MVDTQYVGRKSSTFQKHGGFLNEWKNIKTFPTLIITLPVYILVDSKKHYNLLYSLFIGEDTANFEGKNFMFNYSYRWLQNIKRILSIEKQNRCLDNIELSIPSLFWITNKYIFSNIFVSLNCENTITL